MEALLNEEIDIEIALRERLKNVVESRLNLALLLHEAAARHSDPVKDEGNISEKQIVLVCSHISRWYELLC